MDATVVDLGSAGAEPQRALISSVARDQQIAAQSVLRQLRRAVAGRDHGWLEHRSINLPWRRFEPQLRRVDRLEDATAPPCSPAFDTIIAQADHAGVAKVAGEGKPVADERIQIEFVRIRRNR